MFSLVQTLFSKLLSNWAGSWSPSWMSNTAYVNAHEAPHRIVTTAARGQGVTAGVSQYDGQGSGSDYNLGGGFAPPTGWVNNTDGGRSVLFPDYKQNYSIPDKQVTLIKPGFPKISREKLRARVMK